MILADEEATAGVARALAPVVRGGDIVTLEGTLGAGKTSFARALIAALGHRGEVPSPTFPIVLSYEQLSLPVWHADLYRIEDPEDLTEIGLEEASGGLLLVEWPERAGPDAFRGALRLKLEIEPDDCRRLTADVPPSWEGRWPFA